MRIGAGPKAALLAAIVGAVLVPQVGAAEPRPEASAEAAASASAAAAPAAEEAGDRLGAMIERQLRAEGPFFTPEERAVIERACGYAPGAWDGFDVNISDNVLTCTNGRRADSAEVRAVLRAAEPRIEARVGRVMASPEVAAAIARVAEQASVEALRAVALAMAEFEGPDIDVDVDPGDGLDLDVDVDVDPDDDEMDAGEDRGGDDDED